MKEIIQSKLKEIEEKENVRILHAVESGSRAWGFPSPDSDYDVRFIYVRPREFYLRLDKTRDVIEWQLDDTLDINGWDFQKALRLLHSSNSTLFEWNNSPIVYKTSNRWENIRKEIDGYFVAKSVLHHYLNSAINNYSHYFKGERVKLKKYFYVMRPLLACKWILDKKCPPPILFSELVAAELEAEMKPIVEDLLRKKMSNSEMEEGPQINKLNDYLDRNIVLLKEKINQLPKEKVIEWKKLNELFLQEVNFAE